MLVEECWQLCNAGEMGIAEQVLTSFLPTITQIAPHQSDAAMVAAQGLRLHSILCAHQLQLLNKIFLCQQAVEYARCANDTNTLVASLTELAVAFKYAQQPENSFNTYQETLHYCDHTSPLLRSRVYAATAAAFAQRGHAQEAHRYISLAYEQFPDHPEDDACFSLADSGIFLLAYYKGLMHLALQQTQEAEMAFESFKTHPSGNKVPERNRLEILNYQGRAAILSNNLGMYAYCLEDGIAGAIALKSRKRFDEALRIYQHDMPQAWKQEPLIKQIAEQFQLAAGEQ